MPKLDTNVLIQAKEAIPIQLIQESNDSVGAMVFNNLPLLITIAIVCLTAFVNYRSSKKVIETQNETNEKSRKADHENKISEFRHAWIQDLRNSTAELCQIIYELQRLVGLRNIHRKNMEQAKASSDNVKEARSKYKVEQYSDEIKKHRANFNLLYSRMKLLFKKDEIVIKAAFDAIEKVKLDINNLDVLHIDDDNVELIIFEMQVVLKQEWEATKNRTWV